VRKRDIVLVDADRSTASGWSTIHAIAETTNYARVPGSKIRYARRLSSFQDAVTPTIVPIHGISLHHLQLYLHDALVRSLLKRMSDRYGGGDE